MNTSLKDLTEVEKMILGSSLNFASNIINIHITHIENHDPKLMDLIRTNSEAQAELILLKNVRQIADKFITMIGDDLSKCSDDDLRSLSIPALKLDSLYKSVFNTVNCSDDKDSQDDF